MTLADEASDPVTEFCMACMVVLNACDSVLTLNVSGGFRRCGNLAAAQNGQVGSIRVLDCVGSRQGINIQCIWP